MRLTVIGLISLLFVSLSSTSASLVWLQNDGFSMGGTVYYQAGFVANEICASVFNPGGPDYPVKLMTVRTLVQAPGGASVTGTFKLKIWADSGILQPGTLLHESTQQLTSAAGWVDTNISAANIVVASGGIRVGWEFQAAPPPSFCRDADGNIQTHKNLIYAVPGGWNWSETFGLQGDWVLRLQVDTNYASTTATPTPTLPPYTPTPTPPPPTVTPTTTGSPFTPTRTPTPTPTATGTTYSPTPTPTQPTTAGSIAWDADQYYSAEAHARLTVVDADLNTNPEAQETIEIKVWSQSDPYPSGITITLYESSFSSATFQTVFPHVGFSETASDDAENLILVKEGDAIYARYNETSPPGERIDSAVWHVREGISIELVMPSHTINDNDLCYLHLDFVNSGETQAADLYVILEVFGSYYFYPSWGMDIDHDDIYVPGNFTDTIEIIGNFTMPPVDPVGPLYFYAALFEDGQLSIETMISNLASWEFELR